jgi:ribosomal protein S18 acetylase RimI-like enzyme
MICCAYKLAPDIKNIQMTTISIRGYVPDDRAGLVKIWRAASEQAHHFLTMKQLDGQEILVRDSYLPQTENWVATIDDVPAGFIGLMGDRVGGLFVAPAWQGKGIGRMLVEDSLVRKGRLELEVYTSNTSARAFYERLGFVEVSRRSPDDNGLPFELIKLVR